MKTLSRRFGQWAMIGSATAALVVAPRASSGAEPAANATTNQVSPPAVQIVKPAVGTLPPNYKPSWLTEMKKGSLPQLVIDVDPYSLM